MLSLLKSLTKTLATDNNNYYLLLCARFCCVTATFCALPYLIILLTTSYGFSTQQAASITFAIAVSGYLATLFVGSIVDNINPKKASIAATLLLSASFATISTISTDNKLAMIMLAIIFGSSDQLIVVALQTIIALQTPKKDLACAFIHADMARVLGKIFGPLIAYFCLITNTPKLCFKVGAILYLIGTGFLVFYRYKHKTTTKEHNHSTIKSQKTVFFTPKHFFWLFSLSVAFSTLWQMNHWLPKTFSDDKLTQLAPIVLSLQGIISLLAMFYTSLWLKKRTNHDNLINAVYASLAMCIFYILVGIGSYIHQIFCVIFFILAFVVFESMILPTAQLLCSQLFSASSKGKGFALMSAAVSLAAGISSGCGALFYERLLSLTKSPYTYWTTIGLFYLLVYGIIYVLYSKKTTIKYLLPLAGKILLINCLIYSYALGRSTIDFAVGVNHFKYKPSPLNSMNAQERFLSQLFYETLVVIGRKDTIKPGLANNWSYQPKNNTLVFSLKKNLRFANGIPMTAKEVGLALKQLCSHQNTGNEMRGIANCPTTKMSQVVGITALSAQKIALRINTPPHLALKKLASAKTMIFYQDRNHNLHGSGAYSLQITPKKAILSPNKYYLNKPPRYTINLYALSAYETQKKLLQQHLVGALAFLNDDTLYQLKNSNYRLHMTRPTLTFSLFFNNQTTPFNSLSLRKAIADEIKIHLAKIKLQQPDTLAYGIIPQGIPGAINKKLLPLTKSKKLADIKPKQQGQHTLHMLKAWYRPELQKMLTEVFKKFNVKILFKYHHTYDTLWPLYLNNKADIFCEYLALKDQDPMSIFHFFLPDNKENVANIVDDKLKRLIITAPTIANKARRYHYYQQINHHISQQAYIVPLFYRPRIAILHKCLSGYQNGSDYNPYQFLTTIKWHCKK